MPLTRRRLLAFLAALPGLRWALPKRKPRWLVWKGRDGQDFVPPYSVCEFFNEVEDDRAADFERWKQIHKAKWSEALGRPYHFVESEAVKWAMLRSWNAENE